MPRRHNPASLRTPEAVAGAERFNAEMYITQVRDALRLLSSVDAERILGVVDARGRGHKALLRQLREARDGIRYLEQAISGEAERSPKEVAHADAR